MPRKPSSVFGEWFRAQYGPEPLANTSLAELQDAVDAARRALTSAEARLCMRETRLTARHAAAMAWQAAKPKRV